MMSTFLKKISRLPYQTCDIHELNQQYLIVFVFSFTMPGTIISLLSFGGHLEQCWNLSDRVNSFQMRKYSTEKSFSFKYHSCQSPSIHEINFLKSFVNVDGKHITFVLGNYSCAFPICFYILLILLPLNF